MADMNIALEKFSEPCTCGKTHSLLTKVIVIESGAIKKLSGILASLGLSKRGVMVCDSNTAPFADQIAVEIDEALHPIKPCIVLNPEGLHADERSTAKVACQLPVDACWILAVGSGTIHDTVRYVAKERGINFVSFPTAASVDGFVSAVSAMTWQGFKKTMDGVAPIAVVADTDIFSKAPYHLTASGIGDVLGKYISLVDWRMANILIGEDYCERIAELTREAVDKIRDNLQGIRAGDPDAYEQLLYAQLLSGLAMQMWGNSRPASGSEHHFSHFWEMEVLNPHLTALHGEKVGVGLGISLPYYKKFAAVEDMPARLVPYPGYPEARLREVFGEMYDDIAVENQPDVMTLVDPKVFLERFGEIKALIDALPDAEQLRDEMDRAGCNTTVEQIGVNPADIAVAAELSPYIRSRLTLMRLRKITDIEL
jgi:glycerol-1-phosphate dehydrogenase [NAD(P)+]